MSDTIACSNCGTQVPAAAAFCTGCGQSLAGAAAAPPPPPPPAPVEPPAEDVTRVETPGLNDATQVTPPPPSDPAPSPYAAPAPPPPAAPAGPWGPSTSEPPTAAPWTPPTSATPPPPAPAAPAGPAWQQPAPPSPSGYPPASGAPAGGTWNSPAAPAAAPWGGAPAEAAPAKKTGGSILGGLVGLVGAVLALVGVFSGWVKLGSTGTVTAWSLTEGEGLLKTQTPYAIVAFAAASVIVSLVLLTGIARPVARILAILLGIAIIGTTAANWAEIASFVTDNFPSSFKATTAIGFYLTIVGGVLVILSALMPAKKK